MEPLGPDMTPELQNILDTFSHDGARFLAVRSLYAEMRRRAETGDEAAKSLVKIVHDFSRFIDVAHRLANA